jgi:glycerol transport system ATP-binding protein
MARITLQNLAHSYLPNPQGEDDYALKEFDHVWADGEAYALLGGSGCGKTTLLNIISGLLRPSRGRILFDDQDVTEAPTAARNIAQVFQFPVVYDTLTVRDNLAFPLRNRGLPADQVAARVQAVARCWASRVTSSATPAASRRTPSRRSASAAAWSGRTSTPSSSTSPSPSSTRR